MDPKSKKDPVCGMDVVLPSKYVSERQGEVYAFCAAGCKTKFDADPAKYAGEEASVEPMAAPEGNFTPLILIVAGIAGLTALKYFVMAESGMRDAMTDFMGMFFVVFGGFKLLDMKGFADAYATYDVIAKKSRLYAQIYPFLELVLGLGYLFRWNVAGLNWAALILMSVGSIGVLQAVRSKRKIRCACLGTKIKLPMTKITLLEDLLMAAMALGMIFRQ